MSMRSDIRGNGVPIRWTGGYKLLDSDEVRFNVTPICGIATLIRVGMVSGICIKGRGWTRFCLPIA